MATLSTISSSKVSVQGPSIAQSNYVQEQYTSVSALPSMLSAATAPNEKKSTRRKPVKWTPAEDARLLQGVEQCQELSWSKIAQFVGNKSAYECYQHYHRVLHPNISKKKFGREEYFRLVWLVKTKGFCWSAIAHRLGTGRTDTMCRAKYLEILKGKTDFTVYLRRLLNDCTVEEVSHFLLHEGYAFHASDDLVGAGEAPDTVGGLPGADGATAPSASSGSVPSSTGSTTSSPLSPSSSASSASSAHSTWTRPVSPSMCSTEDTTDDFLVQNNPAAGGDRLDAMLKKELEQVPPTSCKPIPPPSVPSTDLGQLFCFDSSAHGLDNHFPSNWSSYMTSSSNNDEAGSSGAVVIFPEFMTSVFGASEPEFPDTTPSLLERPKFHRS